MKKTILSVILFFLIIGMNKNVWAHCEVPCGIYNDELRIAALYEDVMTISKAMTNIKELSAEENPNFNQIVRWVNTKEEHANKIQETVKQYFLAQRIKVVEETDAENFAKYQKQLVILHKLIVYAMKTKQTTDTEWTDKLKSTIKDFEDAYFDPEHRHKIEDAH